MILVIHYRLLKWLQSPRLVNIDKCIISAWKYGGYIISTLIMWMINHTNCPVSKRLVKYLTFFIKYDHFIMIPSLVQQSLPAARYRLWNLHNFNVTTPLISSDDRSLIRPKAYCVYLLLTKLLSNQLSNIDHSISCHIRSSSITDMCVVLPYDSLRMRTVKRLNSR